MSTSDQVNGERQSEPEDCGAGCPCKGKQGVRSLAFGLPEGAGDAMEIIVR